MVQSLVRFVVGDDESLPYAERLKNYRPTDSLTDMSAQRTNMLDLVRDARDAHTPTETDPYPTIEINGEELYIKPIDALYGKNMPKRPSVMTFQSNNVILGKEELPSSGVINEIVVDNWKYEGFIVADAIIKDQVHFEKLAKLCKENNLKLYSKGDPNEEIEI